MSSPPPDYGLSLPCEADLLVSLGRLVGPEGAATLWESVCADAGVQRQHGALPPASFEKALTCLKLRGGLASIAARSFLLRLNTHQTLARPRPIPVL